MGRFTRTWCASRLAWIGLAGLLLGAGVGAGSARADEEAPPLGKPPADEVGGEMPRPVWNEDPAEGPVVAPPPPAPAPAPVPAPAPAPARAPAPLPEEPAIRERPVLRVPQETELVQALPSYGSGGGRRAADGWQCRRWELVAEATGSWLPQPTGSVGEPVGAGTLGLDWGGVSYDVEPGGRLTVRYATGPRTKLEARGTWYGEWTGSSTQTGSFGFFPPAGSASPTLTARLETESRLAGGELSLWQEVRCSGRTRWKLGVGGRYVRFDEKARMRGGQILGAAGAGFVESDVTNDLLAGQFAAAVYADVSRRLELGLIGKGLVGGVRRKVEIADAFLLGGGGSQARDEENAFGWGGEIEANLLFRVTSRVGVTAGVAFLYLGNQVRAPDAMDFTQATSGAVQARQEKSGLWVTSVFVGLHVNF